MGQRVAQPPDYLSLRHYGSVSCLRSRSSKAKGVMHLLRCLIFVEAFYGFVFEPQYINTVTNDLADDLSRGRLSSFLLKVPSANRHPSSFLLELLKLLLDPGVEWSSPACQHRLNSIFNKA